VQVVRRLAVVFLAVLALAACGGGSGKSSDADQVKSAYETFFSSKTPLSERVALLQNGSRFRAVMKSFASNPLASDTSAKVFSVTVQGAKGAKVVYEVMISGGVVPPGKQTGSAVREGGKWKVADASLCALLALNGGLPSVCRA
jgi:hypothetical protein